MRKLLITGSPYWSRYLRNLLVKEGVEARHVSHRGLGRIFSDRSATLLAVGYGTELSPKRILIWVLIIFWWLLHRRRGSVVLYWIGTDVTRAQAGSKLLRRILEWIGAKHICGAPWFVDALRQAGISAQSILFPYDTGPARKLAQSRPGADTLRISTYLTHGGWSNMNGFHILNLGENTPWAKWQVVGMKASDIPDSRQPPSNMDFLGWVSDPLSTLAASHVFVRIVDHDAYSGMVRDAQAMGRTVLYSKSVEGTIDVSGKSLLEVVDILTVLKESLVRNGHHVSSEKASINLPPIGQQAIALINVLGLKDLD